MRWSIIFQRSIFRVWYQDKGLYQYNNWFKSLNFFTKRQIVILVQVATLFLRRGHFEHILIAKKCTLTV